MNNQKNNQTDEELVKYDIITNIQDENEKIICKAKILFDTYETLIKKNNKSIPDEYLEMKIEIIDLYDNLGRYCSKYCQKDDKFIILSREKIENNLSKISNIIIK